MDGVPSFVLDPSNTSLSAPSEPVSLAANVRPTVGFVSLGCPKNLVDSEVMMGQLVARGHELTSHPDQAEWTASGSTVSGSRPCSPATTASGVP